MAFTFHKATKAQAKLRLALHGPSGAGKTYSALSIARPLVGPEGRIVLLDTERGSAAKYSDKFDFDTCEIVDNYNPNVLIEALTACAGAGYDLAIVDSMTHFWKGTGGLLELIDEEVAKMRARGGKPDSFAAWKVLDPLYRRMVNAILASPMHVIVTMRAKQEYVKEQDDRGKTSIRKVGMAPEMRDEFQYEADIEGMLDIDHTLVIGKTRCDTVDGKVFPKPGKVFADLVRAWLTDGAAPRAAPTTMPVSEVAEAAAKVVDAIKASPPPMSVDMALKFEAFRERIAEQSTTGDCLALRASILAALPERQERTDLIMKLRDRKLQIDADTAQAPAAAGESAA